ncbi:MAG: PspA/IM30 family protein, partial [Bryobacteraceae bacterium]
MFQRLLHLLRGFFGLFLTDLEKRNPDALLELEKERLRKQIGNYNEGLAAHAALCERLMSQGRQLETEERELRARTSAQLRAGNRETAGEAALRLQAVRRSLGEKAKELEQAEATYKQLLGAREATIRQAQEKLATLKQQIDDLKIRRATAEMTEMAAGLTSNLGAGSDTLNRLEQMVDEERQLAAGRTRVARDSMPAVPDLAAEQQDRRALADQALAEFAAREGIVLDHIA